MKFIFLGTQGSGKSTQAKLLAKNLQLPLAEMGQIFRDKAGENDAEALSIRKCLVAGELVPDEIAVRTLKHKVLQDEFKNGYILDGYPRNSAQMLGLEKDIDKVFYVKVSDKEAISRLSLRAREDDTREALERRLAIYHQQTEPLLLKFKNQGKLVEIDGERSIEEIHQDILKKVSDYEK